ncbi:hypothetical protein BLNAU_5577 [Blattamonas nauphoetae]|uniref:Uncharacterized protein n=1 Tax=Blattamonas nauphoetae TaxID=2049346 RepID=A0ABQ9Y754_9EUKA|nr:hypothetical protein BLNAU_5577 [Blattamonas nauphoetae]
MLPEPSLNALPSVTNSTRTERDLGPLIADCLQKYRDGDESSKQKTALVVYSLFLSENNDIHKLSEEVMSSGLVEEFCSTLANTCSEELFVSVSGIVSVVVSGASLPFRVGVSSLLPSLVNLVSKSSSKDVESASRVVGHLCRVSMSGGDVEGVLNSGVVEGLCKQSSMIVSCGDGIGSGNGLSVLKSLDSFCMGLKSFLRNEEQSKKTTETKKNERKKEESESRYSVVNRSRAALSEIEWTLRSMIVEIGREEERGGDDKERSEVSNWIGGMLIRHFPSSFVGLGEKKEGVIGVDIGRLRLEMEENEKRREMERRKERERIKAERKQEKEELKRKEEEIEAERRKEKEESARKEEERRKEFERQMAELQAEREANQHLIKEGLEKRKEKEEEERKRKSKVGAPAIELFPQSNYTLCGNTFTNKRGNGGCLVSFEFGAAVARLSLIIGTVSSNYIIGIISSALAANAQTTAFNDLKRGAGGWDLHPSSPRTWLNGNPANERAACQAGAAGQRVVIEADGREGRRTVRMSQEGQTQPAFFTNIPVPFRFAVCLYWKNDSVTIESVEVVKEASMVGGTIPVQM